MVEYILRFTKYADEQLNAIYTNPKVYLSGKQFTEQFKAWNYELLQYIRPTTFIGAKCKGSMSLGRIGELYYNIYEVGGTNVVIIEKFYFRWLPFAKLSKSSKSRFNKIDDAGYGYSVVQDINSQKMAITKPNKQPLTKPVFDDIIGFHHSTEDYNKMHAIGFIGNRVYEILMNGDINILHISKEEYLAMKHRYDEMLRRRLDMIIEKNLKQYLSKNVILEDSRLRRKARLTEGDLHRVIKQCVNQVLRYYM